MFPPQVRRGFFLIQNSRVFQHIYNFTAVKMWYNSYGLKE